MDRNNQRTVCLQREKRYVEAVSTFSFRSPFIAGQSRVGDLQRLVRNYLDRYPEWFGEIQPTHGQLHRVYIRGHFFRTSCLQRDYLFDGKFAGYYWRAHGTEDWHGSIRKRDNSAIISEKGTRLPFHASAPCFNGRPTLSISAPTTDFIHSTPRQENVCLPTTNKIKKVSMPVIKIGRGEFGSGLISVE